MNTSIDNSLIKVVPNHLAIIMDGNGRWATRQTMPRFFGHKKGLENLRTIVEAVMARGIRYLTVWAFSTENWGRPPEEIDYLIELFQKTLEKDIDELHQKGIKLKVVGLRDKLSPKLCSLVDNAMELTKDNQKLTFSVAFNYGGRADMTQALRSLAQDIADGKIQLQDINETMIHDHLLTADLPDPDFVIRTGNVQRLSNFMMWQCGYSELFFSPTLWPDYSANCLDQALLHFQNVERRFGRVKN